MKIAITQIKNGKAKKAILEEKDMKNCIEIPLERNIAQFNRAKLKENLRKMEER